MAESNANDTTNVAMQAGIINEMVDKMAMLLKQNEIYRTKRKRRIR